MTLSKGDIRALADKIADNLLSGYVIKKLLGDMIPIPQEYCPRRKDFTDDIAREIEVYFGQ